MMYENEYGAQLFRLNQLVLNVLTKPAESGRQALTDLISTAAEARMRGEREDDSIMRASAELAYRALSFAFRRYQDEALQKQANEIGLIDFETAKKAGGYVFCEHKVQEFDSLADLENAAQQHVGQRINTLVAMIQSMRRNRPT